MGARNTAFHERTHLHAFAGFEKQAARPDELERVPLDGIMARREHDAARGVMVLYGQLISSASSFKDERLCLVRKSAKTSPIKKQPEQTVDIRDGSRRIA